MKVLKFGGSSLKDADGFIRCAEIILSNDQAVTVVVSASGDTTNQLESLLQLPIQEAKQLLSEIIDSHLSIANQLNLTEQLNPDFNDHYHQVEKLITGLESIKFKPEEALIKVLMQGELMSSRLLQTYIHQQLELTNNSKQCGLLYSNQIIVSNCDANEPVVDFEQSLQQLNSVELLDINITQGFIAVDQNGENCLLGRNGSDLSAAIYAALMNAESCEIWTNVDGIYNADPGIVSNAQVISQLDYQEAMELAYHGAKVLHPKTISPLQNAQIPCWIKNSNNPNSRGSLITKLSLDENAVKGVSFNENISLFNVSGACLKGTKGAAARIFSAIASHNISINLITQSSSEYSISFCVDSKDSLATKKTLEKEFYYELLAQDLNPIEVKQKRAIVSIIGNGLHHKQGIAAQFMHAISLGSINIEAIAQGSSETSISIVIKQVAAKKACILTHQEFFNRKQRLDLMILGCGNVGTELIRQCFQQQQKLLSKNIELRIKMIANSKSYIFSKSGLNANDWSSQLQQSNTSFDVKQLKKLQKDNVLINPTIVDCSCSKIISDQYKHFLELGFNLVTANKKANSESLDYYQKLQKIVQTSFRKYLYETNVGAGLPVVKTLNHLLDAGDQLNQFSGILSGTLSYILGEVESGKLFSEVVKEAQAKGLTEPDPRDDLNGMDVARKLLIIAREANIKAEISDISLCSLLPDSFDSTGSIQEFLHRLKQLDEHYTNQFDEARHNQATIRYVAELRDNKLSVGLKQVKKSDPLYSVKGGENAIAIYSQYYSPIPLVLRGYGAGAQVTAAGLFSDILHSLPHREKESL